jgi:hypothetical protein
VRSQETVINAKGFADGRMRASFTKRSILVVLLALAFVCQASFASALGISQPYLVNNTLYLEQGAYYEHRINIQNAMSIELPLEFGVSGDYLTVAGGKKTVLIVPAQSTDFTVPIAIAVPDQAPPGFEISAQYWVQAIPDGSGVVPMAARLTDGFKVVIVAKPTVKEQVEAWKAPLLASAILMLIAAATLLYVKVKRRKEIGHSEKFREIEAKSLNELLAAIAEMGDSEVRNRLAGGSFARALHRFDKNPERYHRVRVAKNRSELIRALKSPK